MAKYGQKWVYLAKNEKSEENGPPLKFDFTCSRVSQKFLGAQGGEILTLSLKSPKPGGFDTPPLIQYD